MKKSIFRSSVLTAIAVIAASIVLGTQPASATIVTQGPSSPFTVTDITGVGTVTFSPSPATEILDVSGSDYTNDFKPQDPSNIASGIATIFGVSAPTLTADIENLTTDPFTENDSTGFNFAAIHNAQGELVFYYDTLQTTFTLSDTGGTLSNARFYTCAANTSGCSTTAVPEPASLTLLGSALVGLGALGRRRKRV